MRVVLTIVSICLSFFMAQWAFAQPFVMKPQYQEGRHYRVLPKAIETQDANKIEVREIFSYGCPHCYKFQSLLEPWSMLERDDIDYVPMPAIFNDGMKPYGQLYYTLEALDMVEKLHQTVFKGIHRDKKRLDREPAIRAFLVREGLEEQLFNDTFNSDAVLEKVRNAALLTRQYRITGTPELVIDGRYVVGARAVGGHANMLRVVEQLVDQIRLERIYGREKTVGN